MLKKNMANPAVAALKADFDREVEKITVTRISLDSLKRLAIAEMQDEFDDKGQHVNASKARPSIISGWMVDYIRNYLTEYNENFYKADDCGNTFYKDYKEAVFNKIAEVYPELEGVCDEKKYDTWREVPPTDSHFRPYKPNKKPKRRHNMAKRQSSQDEAKVIVTIRNISGGMRENMGGANYKTVKVHDNRMGEDWPTDVIEIRLKITNCQEWSNEDLPEGEEEYPIEFDKNANEEYTLWTAVTQDITSSTADLSKKLVFALERIKDTAAYYGHGEISLTITKMTDTEYADGDEDRKRTKWVYKGMYGQDIYKLSIENLIIPLMSEYESDRREYENIKDDMYWKAQGEVSRLANKLSNYTEYEKRQTKRFEISIDNAAKIAKMLVKEMAAE